MSTSVAHSLIVIRLFSTHIFFTFSTYSLILWVVQGERIHSHFSFLLWKANTSCKYFKFFWTLNFTQNLIQFLKTYVDTKCDQKITAIFKFRELRIFNLLIFSVLLVHMSVIYVDNISHFGLFLAIVSLINKMVSRVLVFSSIFLLFDQMDQRNCFKFTFKIEVNVV